MKKTYEQRKNEFEELTNSTEILRAFSDKQYEEIKPKLEKRKEDWQTLVEFMWWITTKKIAENYNKKAKKKIKEFEKLKRLDNQFLLNAFEYELANHEYCITYDIEDTLDALGFKKNKKEEYNLTKREIKILEIAKKNYLKSIDY